MQSLTGIKQLDVQRYITTIFPCYDNNSQRTIRANQDSHEVEFLDLSGGRKQYVVTLSAIIEDAKMRGLKRVTYLPPYPPQKLVATNNESGVVKISWARPKGEFEKYILKVALLEARLMLPKPREERSRLLRAALSRPRLFFLSFGPVLTSLLSPPRLIYL